MTKSAKKITWQLADTNFSFCVAALAFNFFASGCAAEAEFVSLDDAVLFSGFAAREIVRRAETGKLHYLETSGGHLFVCRKSLNESGDLIDEQSRLIGSETSTTA